MKLLISLFSYVISVCRGRNKSEIKNVCYEGGDKELYERTFFRYNRVVQSLLYKYSVIKRNDNKKVYSESKIRFHVG